MSETSDLISVAKAAKLLNVTTVTVRNYIDSGRLSGEKVGNSYVLKKSDVLKFEKPTAGRPRNKRRAAK